MIDPAWIQAGSSLLRAVATPTPTNVVSGGPTNIGLDFDFSGFTVGTGSAKVTGAPNNKTTTGAGANPAATVAAAASSALPVGLLVAAGAAALAFMTKD